MPKTIRLCKAHGCKNPAAKKRQHCSDACRLWSGVDRSGGPDACWPWRGQLNTRTGYGQFTAYLSAHRMAWRVTHGDPAAACVLHKCDFRPCCNPKHLFLGSRLDNWQDAIDKGRPMTAQPGEANFAAKLTADDVRAIRRSAAKTRDLVKAFGVDKRTILRVIRRESWKHIPDEAVVYFHGAVDRPSAAA